MWQSASCYIYPMFYRKPYFLLLLLLAVLIKIFSTQKAWVEEYYSNGLYPYISLVQRSLFGWIPFSVGDVFYAVIILWLIRQTLRMIRIMKKKQAGRAYWQRVGKRFLIGTLIVYTSFNFLWGLNYNRYGIAHELKLDKHNYTKEDLVELTEQLANRLNHLQEASVTERKQLKRKKYLFKEAVLSYKAYSVADEAILTYKTPSVKPSIFSYLGNYLGFTGYYNPFSGEAQVNTTIPVFTQPFTTCHEIGHQLGYAKESEANFVGYLAAASSENPACRYAVYFDMYAYASRYLYMSDSLALKRINATLSPAVRNDFNELRAFYRKYASPVETAIDKLYAEFLRANEQPSGKMSYNEVVSLLIAYHKKYNRI